MKKRKPKKRRRSELVRSQTRTLQLIDNLGDERFQFSREPIRVQAIVRSGEVSKRFGPVLDEVRVSIVAGAEPVHILHPVNQISPFLTGNVKPVVDNVAEFVAKRVFEFLGRKNDLIPSVIASTSQQTVVHFSHYPADPNEKVEQKHYTNYHNRDTDY